MKRLPIILFFLAVLVILAYLITQQPTIPPQNNETDVSIDEVLKENIYILTDEVMEKNYTVYESEYENRIIVNFSPPIPEDEGPDGWTRSDRHRLILNISGNEWAIARLNSTMLVLGKERESVNTGVCDMYQFNVSNKSVRFADIQMQADEKGEEVKTGLFCELITNGSCANRFNVHQGETKKIGEEYLHVWTVIHGYVWCDRMVDASVFSDIVELDSSYLTFEPGPSLKTITIPKNSSAYMRLVGQEVQG